MRRLPVYFLLDVSESMVGEPIREVRKGLESIVKELRSDPYALETVWISVLAFAGKAEVLEALTELIEFKVPDLPIGSGTSLGSGLELLMAELDNRIQKNTREKKGDWKPIIFLFTDGAPTDDAKKAIEKWNAKFRAGCNLIVITFGNHADVELLSRLTETVLTLENTSPASFRDFFKWVTASIQLNSMAVSESGKDEVSLPQPGINLEKAKPGGSLDEHFAVLRVKCARKKDLWLAKYECADSAYKLVGAYPIDEKRYNALGGQNSLTAEIEVKRLLEIPECPSCKKADGIIHCGCCGQLSCSDGSKEFICPWCGNRGKVLYNSDFSVTRGQG